MGGPRVSITGLSSVFAADLSPLEADGGQAPCVVAPARRVLESRSNNAQLLTGPGSALVGALLGRLGIDCLAALDAGDDGFGLELPRLLQPATPHLRPLLRHVPGVATTLAVDEGFLDGGQSPSQSSRFLPDLPPLEELRGGIGIWAGAEHCEPASVGAAFLLPDALQRFEDTGLTRVVALSQPGDALVRRNAENSWLQSCARHAEILCVQADHLLQYLDPGAAARMLDRDLLPRLPEWLQGSLLHEVASFLLDLGVGAVLIGLREQGVYLRTHADGNRVVFARRFAPNNEVAAYLATWIDREMLVPLFEAEARNTYSRPAALVAGFTAGLCQGQEPSDLMLAAAAVVSLAGEQPNPLEGVPPWEVVQARVEGGWSQAHCQIDLSGWGEGDPHTW